MLEFVCTIHSERLFACSLHVFHATHTAHIHTHIRLLDSEQKVKEMSEICFFPFIHPCCWWCFFAFMCRLRAPVCLLLIFSLCVCLCACECGYNSDSAFVYTETFLGFWASVTVGVYVWVFSHSIPCAHTPNHSRNTTHNIVYRGVCQCEKVYSIYICTHKYVEKEHKIRVERAMLCHSLYRFSEEEKILKTILRISTAPIQTHIHVKRTAAAYICMSNQAICGASLSHSFRSFASSSFSSFLFAFFIIIRKL